MSDDIIDDLMDGQSSERLASGLVNGVFIQLVKQKTYKSTGEVKWKVIAETPHRIRSQKQELYDEVSEADSYFEMLIEKYDLSEGIPDE